MTNIEMQNKYVLAYTSVINKGYIYGVYVLTLDTFFYARVNRLFNGVVV